MVVVREGLTSSYLAKHSSKDGKILFEKKFSTSLTHSSVFENNVLTGGNAVSNQFWALISSNLTQEFTCSTTLAGFKQT